MPSPAKPSFPNWTEQPLFFAALLFSAGIVTVSLLPIPGRQWAILVVTLTGCAFLLVIRRHDWAVVISLWALLPLGGLNASLESASRPVRPDLPGLTTETMEITAHVTATALPRFNAAERELRTIEVATETIGDGTRVQNFVVGARLTLHDNGKSIPDLRYGDRLRFVARLREPRNYGNPGAMDYRGYLEGKGIAALASVPSTSIELLPGKTGTRWGFWRARI